MKSLQIIVSKLSKYQYIYKASILHIYSQNVAFINILVKIYLRALQISYFAQLSIWQG